MSNSIFSSPIVNGVVLGALTAGVAAYGGTAGGALKDMIGDNAEGWQKLANTALDAVGGGLETAAKSLNESGAWMAEKAGLKGRIDSAILPAIAAGLAGTALTGLVSTTTSGASSLPYKSTSTEPQIG
jgi:hypothetical protein